jgi:hypothetical protein
MSGCSFLYFDRINMKIAYLIIFCVKNSFAEESDV